MGVCARCDFFRTTCDGASDEKITEAFGTTEMPPCFVPYEEEKIEEEEQK
jgi:hypothetical protein